MEFFEVVQKRHSYRGGFENKAIPREDLKKIVQAGQDAPSGCNAQTTHFVIVDDPGLVRKIGAMEQARKAMQQAKAFILCVVDEQPKGVYEDLSFQVEDCAAAVENMLLAITALGYGSVWIDGWLRREGRAEAIGQWLSLPAGKCVRILLPVGVPSETVQPPAKKAFAERVSFNAYGRGE